MSSRGVVLQLQSSALIVMIIPYSIWYVRNVPGNSRQMHPKAVPDHCTVHVIVTHLMVTRVNPCIRPFPLGAFPFSLSLCWSLGKENFSTNCLWGFGGPVKAMNGFRLVSCPSFRPKTWSPHWLYRQHLGGSDEVYSILQVIPAIRERSALCVLLMQRVGKLL